MNSLSQNHSAYTLTWASSIPSWMCSKDLWSRSALSLITFLMEGSEWGPSEERELEMPPNIWMESKHQMTTNIQWNTVNKSWQSATTRLNLLQIIKIHNSYIEHTHTYIHTYMYIYICMCVYTYVYIHTYTHISNQ